jgi:transcriptional regulator with XRE-family HTH domain
MANFAERLAAARRLAGLSQYALARRSGVSKQALSLLELGERAPTWETVQLLALALGVSTEDFRDPGLTLPPEKPPPRMGRPPKVKVAKNSKAPPDKARGRRKGS